VVIPIIVYNGNTPCNFANSVKKLFEIFKEIKRYVEDFRKCILDLSVFNPELIKDSPPSAADYCGGHGKLIMMLLALKYSRSPDVLNVLPQIIRISEKIPNGDCDYLKVVLLYLASVINKGFIDQFWKIVAKEHSGGEVYMETIADAFREEERLKREKAEREVAELRKEIKQKEAMIERKDTKLEEEHSKLEQKNTELEQKDTELALKKAELEKKNEYLYRIIKGMLKKGMDQKTIEEITGLGSAEIKQIINSLSF